MTRWLPPEPVAPRGSFLFDLDGRCTETVPHGGLTVIDTFAAAALTGLLHRHGNTPVSHEMLAEEAYNIAEAMAAERQHRYG